MPPAFPTGPSTSADACDQDHHPERKSRRFVATACRLLPTREEQTQRFSGRRNPCPWLDTRSRHQDHTRQPRETCRPSSPSVELENEDCHPHRLIEEESIRWRSCQRRPGLGSTVPIDECPRHRRNLSSADTLTDGLAIRFREPIFPEIRRGSRFVPDSCAIHAAIGRHQTRLPVRRYR